MLSERTIINGLILVAGLLFGPYLIILTFESNQLALVSFAALVFLFFIFFLVRDKIAVGPFVAGSFGGTLNFLPGGLTPVELICLMSIFYYFINYVALKRKLVDGGPIDFLAPMLVIGGIVLIHDHKIGLSILGRGGEEGSRPGLLIIVAIMAYICGINIPTPSAKFISRLPLWCLFLTCLGSLPFIVTTYFPSAAPYVYYVSGNVNLDAYAQSLHGGDTDDLSRNGAFLGIGGTLQGILVAYFGINTWWRPSRWPVIVLSLLCFFAILSGGYRNALLGFALTTLFGAICYSRWRVAIILPLLFIAPIAVIMIQNDHLGGIVLPSTIQRTMSFLPGNWDPEVVSSAESSNSFREDVSRVYFHDYFYKSPWIGNGFTFDPSESEGLDALSHLPGATDRGYFETKAFIVSKNFHIGWISLYDAVGLIGGVAYIILNGTMIWTAGKFVFSRHTDMNSPLFPLKVWLFTSLSVGVVGYFTTFGNFGQSMVSLCTVGVVLFHLGRIERSDYSRDVAALQLPINVARRPAVFSPLGTPSK